MKIISGIDDKYMELQTLDAGDVFVFKGGYWLVLGQQNNNIRMLIETANRPDKENTIYCVNIGHENSSFAELIGLNKYTRVIKCEATLSIER